MNRRWVVGGLVALAACHSSSDSDPLPGYGAAPPMPPDAGLGFGPLDGVQGTPDFDAGLHAVPPPVRLQLRTAASSPPPIAGGGLAVRKDGLLTVVGDPDRDAIFVLEGAARSVRRLSLAKGSEPGRVAFDGTGKAHVILRGAGKLLRIDGGQIGLETAVCSQPRGVAYQAAHDALVVACLDGQLVTLDAGSHRELSRRLLEQDLRDVVVGLDGKLLVSRYRSAELLTLDSDTAAPRTGVPATAHVPRLEFPEVLLPEGVSVASLPPPSMVAMSPALAWRTTISGGKVWMLHEQSQQDEVVAAAGGYGGGCSSIVQGAITAFGLDGQPTGSMPVQMTGLAVDVAASPNGEWLAVAAPGGYLQANATLQLYSTSQGLELEPTGGSCSARVQQTAGREGQTVAVAFDGAGLLYAFSREPAELTVYSISGKVITDPTVVTAFDPILFNVVAAVALDGQSVRDTGHELFHTDVGSGLSCAACHGEAQDDGHIWTFQNIGARRTQSMRGGIMSTAPFHWDGDMITFSHLVTEVMTGRMGGFMVEEPFQAALSQWIDRQPALRLEAKDAAAVARGQRLFASSETQCASCHSGDAFTNNRWADVGTGGPFQVPQLRGLGLRAPYMHDGCAATLAERFEPGCGGGDQHGKSSQLTSAQLADLIAYLETL